MAFALGIALVRDPICRCIRQGWYRAHRRIYFGAWRIVRTLRRRLLVVALGSVFGALGVYLVVTLTFPRKYEASSVMIVRRLPDVSVEEFE